MGAARAEKAPLRAWLSLAGGALLCLAYLGWLVAQPRGLFEFGYAPFTPEPLPYSPMRGFTYEQLWGHVARFFLLTPALLLVTWGGYRLWPGALAASAQRLNDGSRRLVGFACASCLALTTFTLLAVLRGRAIVDDELVYRMQATFLAHGQLTGPDIGVTPPDVFSIETRLGYTGKYLPGEALVQVPGLWLGLPALLHVPIVALTLFAFHRATALRTGERIADFSTLALSLSPMLILTSATGLTQATSLCCLALAGLGFEWCRGGKPSAGGLLAGFAISFGVATRPQAMIPAGLVFGPLVLYSLARRRSWLGLGAYALTLGAGFTLIGAYNHALTGSPLTLPWYLQCSVEHFGFGRVWTTDNFIHTPITAVENLLVVAVRWNAWWLGFPASLAVLGIGWRFWRQLRGASVWLWVALALLGFEFLYYSPGISDTGAIYHYELLLPCSLIAGATLNAALGRWPALTAAAVFTHVALGTTSWFGEQTLRLARLVEFIHADSDALLARIPSPALLFHELRGSESRATGWVFDSFPKRFRGLEDPVVTFPMLVPALRAEVQKAYPGRSCWYYRRNPISEAAEVHRCDDVPALMDRVFAPDEVTAIWIRPTAYNVTDYDAGRAIANRRRLDASGKPMLLCCGMRYATKLGARVRPEALATCVEDGSR
jgi:hypothetical protein